VSLSATTESVGCSAVSVVSSANWSTVELLCLGRFLTKMLNRSGLRPEPYGKLLETIIQPVTSSYVNMLLMIDNPLRFDNILSTFLGDLLIYSFDAI